MRRKPSKAGVAGVTQDLAGRYMAYITINRKAKHLGCFDDRFEAICARKSAENRRHLQPAEEKHMTTPERGLFERIKDSIDMHHCCNFPQQIEKICSDFEQQLAEARAKYKDAMADLIFRNTDLKVAHNEIAQLRARCGELEKVLGYLKNPTIEMLKAGECSGMCGDGGVRAVEFIIDSDTVAEILANVIAATPQPAQEQKGAQSLLRTYDSPLPSGCYCEPGKCMAPRIMGVQQSCRDPQKAKQEQKS